MKKVLTLVLALVFVLALAAPAMAFTGDTTAAVATSYKLKVYLVEANTIGFFGGATLPAADRGYAKDETVAAIAELTIPKNGNPGAGDDAAYTTLYFSGKNVSFFETKNNPSLAAVPANGQMSYTLKHIGLDGAIADLASDGAVANATSATKFQYTLTNNFDNSGNDEKTVKWLYFARVTGDDASLTVKLVDQSAPATCNTNVATFNLNGRAYQVTRPTAVPGHYDILVQGTGGYTGTGIQLFVDGDRKTTDMHISAKGGAATGYYNVTRENGVLVFTSLITATLGQRATGDTYNGLMNVYNDVVVGVFGLNYDSRGNFLRDKFFEDLVSKKTVVASVDIKPWTAYVKVPDNVVVNPPKTGAAASILGFVMVALAGASAVALKKR